MGALKEVQDHRQVVATVEVVQLLLDDCAPAQTAFAANEGYAILRNRLEHALSLNTDMGRNALFLNSLFDLLTARALFHSSRGDGKMVQNPFAIDFLGALLLSKSLPLVNLSLRIIDTVLQSNPNNIFDLEYFGITSSLSRVLVNIVCFSSISMDGFELSKEDSGLIDSFYPHTNISPSLPFSGSPSKFKSYLSSSSPLYSPHSQVSSPYNSPVTETKHYLKQDEYDFEEFMLTTIELIRLLQHMAVISSLRDVSCLAFLTSLVYVLMRNKNTLPVFYNFSPYCQNCENNPAHYECIHPACVMESCFCLCSNCDAVFHKAIMRRSHYRMPINTGGGLVSLFPFMDSKLNDIIRSGLSSSRLPREPIQPLVSLCILLGALRGLLDDRRAREQYIPSELLEPLLMAQRSTITCSITLCKLCDISSLKNKELVTYLSRLVEHRDDSVVSAGSSIAMEEPPEISRTQLLRVSSMLFQQTVARFFVFDTVENVEWTEAPSPFDPVNMQLPKRKIDQQCTRRELSFRLQTFLKTGGDAMIAFLVTESSGRVSLTASDRHVLIWILREIIVTGLFSEPEAVAAPLSWLMWLLSCPADNQNSAINLALPVKLYVCLHAMWFYFCYTSIIGFKDRWSYFRDISSRKAISACKLAYFYSPGAAYAYGR